MNFFSTQKIANFFNGTTVVAECTITHEMVAEESGTVLREEKSQKIEKTGESKSVNVTHKRTIEKDGSKTEYTVKKLTKDGESGENVVETTMKETELDDFQEKWHTLWQPLIGD
jgi:hypothetical protein